MDISKISVGKIYVIDEILCPRAKKGGIYRVESKNEDSRELDLVSWNDKTPLRGVSWLFIKSEVRLIDKLRKLL